MTWWQTKGWTSRLQWLTSCPLGPPTSSPAPSARPAWTIPAKGRAAPLTTSKKTRKERQTYRKERQRESWLRECNKESSEMKVDMRRGEGRKERKKFKKRERVKLRWQGIKKKNKGSFIDYHNEQKHMQHFRSHRTKVYKAWIDELINPFNNFDCAGSL